MQLLHNYHRTLQQLGAMTLEAAASGCCPEQTASGLAEAAVMDMQAQELLQKLQGAGISCSSPTRSVILSRAHGSRTTGHSADAGVLRQSCGPEEMQHQSRTQRLWASVTPEAIAEMHSITGKELAGGGWGLLGQVGRRTACEGPTCSKGRLCTLSAVCEAATCMVASVPLLPARSARRTPPGDAVIAAPAPTVLRALRCLWLLPCHLHTERFKSCRFTLC